MKTDLHAIPRGDVARMKLHPLAHIHVLRLSCIARVRIVPSVQGPPVVRKRLIFIGRKPLANPCERKKSRGMHEIKGDLEERVFGLLYRRYSIS